MDGVERQTELTPRQKAIIRGIFDGMLRDLHSAVVDNFSHKEHRVEIEKEAGEEL